VRRRACSPRSSATSSTALPPRPLLKAIARYPTPRPERLFHGIKNTVGHRLLDVLRAELHGHNPRGIAGAELAAAQNTLHDLDELEAPAMAADSPRRREVRRVAVGADLPTLVGHYAEHHEVRDACRRALGRLAPRQQQVVEAVELGDYSPEEFAERRRVTRSTVYNLAAQARNRMHDDDIVFVELHRLRIVRDQARIAYLQARYPDGYPARRPPPGRDRRLTARRCSGAGLRSLSDSRPRRPLPVSTSVNLPMRNLESRTAPSRSRAPATTSFRADGSSRIVAEAKHPRERRTPGTKEVMEPIEKQKKTWLRVVAQVARTVTLLFTAALAVVRFIRALGLV
jgi:hypothetical protein